MAKPPEKPVKPLSSLGENLFRSLREAVGTEFNPCGSDLVNFTPHVDIYTTQDSIIIEAEIPGVNINDIDISIIKGQLLIKGVKSEVINEEDTGNYVCMERSFGRYYRAIEIPFPVNTQNIKASYKCGVLVIEAPRVDDKRGQPKRIEIESD
ncbi:MAG: Hsp20/alpha crystallin family protein [Thermodesulfobacteriota bacterium]